MSDAHDGTDKAERCLYLFIKDCLLLYKIWQEWVHDAHLYFYFFV